MPNSKAHHRLESRNMDEHGQKGSAWAGPLRQGKGPEHMVGRGNIREFTLRSLLSLWNECPGYCVRVKASGLSWVSNLERRTCHHPCGHWEWAASAQRPQATSSAQASVESLWPSRLVVLSIRDEQSKQGHGGSWLRRQDSNYCCLHFKGQLAIFSSSICM